MMMAKSAGSPSRSIKSDQTDSVLTESTDEESNFISVLQYKDAFHLLGLKEESYPGPAEIRAAYTTCREQTIAALERCEANEKQQQPARGSFLISQTNYLELKLNALDQAIYELLPEDSERNNINDARQSDQQIQQCDVSSPPLQQDTVEQDRKRQLILGSPSAQPQPQPKEQLQTQEPRNKNGRASARKDDDDLDTIDIYFNSPKNREPKASDQSDAISIITWDASSIFSMISNSKTNEDAASESGLSDVLGSVKKGKEKNDIRRKVAAPNKSSMSRPPLTIKRATTSPRSITDFPPSIHDQGRFKEVGRPVRKKKVITARGRFPQSTSDAVRKGVMRALDEDDSECVSLDFEDGYPQIAAKQQSTIEKGNRYHETTRAMPKDRKSKGVSKRDGHQNRGRDHRSDNDQASAASSKDDDVGVRYNRRRPRKQAEPEEDFYDSLMDGYNAALESSMQISNQLCDALQSCWVDASTFENPAADEGSEADDLTGVSTDGESTAFNTLSSFSKCGSTEARGVKLGDLDKRRLV
mmetsp:Transcript_5128/g.7823  ORF Transcript_5128/g.7823 Transcript_5128/m.7823 type:complete len:529 (-) Transcript_5128:69-1655(-)